MKSFEEKKQEVFAKLYNEARKSDLDLLDEIQSNPSEMTPKIRDYFRREKRKCIKEFWTLAFSYPPVLSGSSERVEYANKLIKLHDEIPYLNRMLGLIRKINSINNAQKKSKEDSELQDKLAKAGIFPGGDSEHLI